MKIENEGDDDMGNIKLFVENDYTAMSRRAAEIFARVVSDDPTGAFGFATGGTPEGMYAEMIKMQLAGEADFSRLTAFNLDEYYPIDQGHEQSYEYYMAKNLFDHINLPMDKRNIPYGDAKDPSAEAERYDKLVIDSKINMQILGIGHNGHIAFNEPADSFRAATGHVALAQSTVEANARYFESSADVPRHALTMGIKTIMMARNIMLLVSGEAKAPILWDAMKGLITPLVPASVLQLHPSVIVVADTAAARHLSNL